tara:strand:- start:961 stop:1854 length:894 start_codon:yes stop_codon:yes gene_type:complete
MNTKILNGIEVAKFLKKKIKQEVISLKNKNIKPGLAAILIGNNPASQIYIKNKERVFLKHNCFTKTFNFSDNASDNEIIEFIEKLNNDNDFHGILVQLPLPNKFNTKKILHSVNPKKDVDGFHPLNLGLLAEGNPNFIPCTPSGVIEILKYYDIKTTSKNIVIIGRSNIVGKPMYSLLSQNFVYGNATVTLCHSKTKNINSYTKNADILIVAVGVPNMVDASIIKKGVDIIDVGINRVNDSSKKGYRIVGDVNFDSVMGIANSITPVPGGVGPLTITMLLHNTVKACKQLCTRGSTG